MCLRGAQTHKNNKEFFSYFEPLDEILKIRNQQFEIPD